MEARGWDERGFLGLPTVRTNGAGPYEELNETWELNPKNEGAPEKEKNSLALKTKEEIPG